jgi:hypothetical protein
VRGKRRVKQSGLWHCAPIDRVAGVLELKRSRGAFLEGNFRGGAGDVADQAPKALSTCNITDYFGNMVRVKGLEPPRLAAPEPKSGASTNSATPAWPAAGHAAPLAKPRHQGERESEQNFHKFSLHILKT